MTEADLLDALRSAVEDAEIPEGFMTAAQIQDATGRSRDWVSRKLRNLGAAGKLEVITVRKSNITGGHSSVPAYRFLDQTSGSSEGGGT